MADVYARQFSEILGALTDNDRLRESVCELIRTEAIAGKVTEGENRIDQLRAVLIHMVEGSISLTDAIDQCEVDLSRHSSMYALDNRVFASNWSERLIRTQLSRFYNHAVLKQLLEEGQEQCFVPHTDVEQSSSRCSATLAGYSHNTATMLETLIDNYSNGNWSSGSKIPEHPHCSHVVTSINAN